MGYKNQNKNNVKLKEEMAQVEAMLKSLLARVSDKLNFTYFVDDGLLLIMRRR